MTPTPCRSWSLAPPSRGADSNAAHGYLPNLEKLRLSQDFEADVGVRKLLTTVPVRKPGGQEFVRVHPDEDYRLPTMVLDLKGDREMYLVASELWSQLADELKPVTLYTAVTRQGVVFLWPVKLPGDDGRLDEWNRSAHEAARIASQRWVRVRANMSLGAYEVFEATGDLPAPRWPDTDLTTLITTAFKARHIDTIEHTVIKRLLGES